MRCQVPHQESQSVNISKPRKKTPEDSSRLLSFFPLGQEHSWGMKQLNSRINLATGPTAEIVWRPKILDFIQFQQRLSVMTPLALAREWARGEPGMGLYMGCLAIRQVKIWAAQLSSVQYVSEFSQAYHVDFLKHIMLCGSPSDFKIGVVEPEF